MPKHKRVIEQDNHPVILIDELWLVRVFDIPNIGVECYIMHDRDNVMDSIFNTWSTVTADKKPRVNETTSDIHVWSQDGTKLFIHARRLTNDFIHTRPTHF